MGYAALPFGADRIVIAFASVWLNPQVLAKDNVHDPSCLNGRCLRDRIAAVGSSKAGCGNARLLRHLLHIHIKWLLECDFSLTHPNCGEMVAVHAAAHALGME